MEKITTIKISKETKERMDKLREHRRETYDDLVRKMLFVMNIVKIDSDKALEVLERIDKIQNKITKSKKKRDNKK